MKTSQKSLTVPDPHRRYRVVQWSTGRIGTCTLRNLLRSPQMEVVGVYVHSEAKAGRDAGELAGLPAIGVAATTSIEEIIALKPDCVVAVQEGTNLDDVCRFLEAGINIATSRVDYVDPESMDPEVRRRTEAACQKGGASIHATGASPGFGSEALPLVAVSMSRTMDCMTIDEFADIPASCPDIQCIEIMHFGRQPGEQFDPHVLAHIGHGFQQSVHILARALGLTLDRCELSGEAANARERFLLPEGTPIEKGTVAAQRITVSGIVNGKPVIRYRINWYCSTDIDQDWELRRSGWRVRIEGESPIDIDVTFPVTGAQISPAMATLTGYRVINAIPYVCAAEPGIRTILDLPNIVPRMG